MQGQRVRGRPIKLNHRTRKKRTQPQHDRQYAYDRWKRSDEAPSRWIPPQQEGWRLYVGGLPRIEPQSAANEQMHKLFKDWPVEAVSKIISPHPSTNNKPGEHYYCFVDLSSPEIAEQASRALNDSKGRQGGTYRISVATKSSLRKVIREQFSGVYPGRDGGQQISPVKSLEGDWRKMEQDEPDRNVSAALSEAY